MIAAILGRFDSGKNRHFWAVFAGMDEKRWITF
jgi:hypothetical protein